jgi:hypothetical protein
LTAIAPGLERAVGERLHQAGVRDLLASYPTLTALRAAGPAQVEATIRSRSPRIAAKVTAAVTAAVTAQDVTMPAEAATMANPSTPRQRRSAARRRHSETRGTPQHPHHSFKAARQPDGTRRGSCETSRRRYLPNRVEAA